MICINASRRMNAAIRAQIDGPFFMFVIIAQVGFEPTLDRF